MAGLSWAALGIRSPLVNNKAKQLIKASINIINTAFIQVGIVFSLGILSLLI
jgi:hypothetical protein